MEESIDTSHFHLGLKSLVPDETCLHLLRKTSAKFTNFHHCTKIVPYNMYVL